MEVVWYPGDGVFFFSSRTDCDEAKAVFVHSTQKDPNI